MENKVSLEFSF